MLYAALINTVKFVMYYKFFNVYILLTFTYGDTVWFAAVATIFGILVSVSCLSYFRSASFFVIFVNFFALVTYTGYICYALF